jgi:hypothetical protein
MNADTYRQPVRRKAVGGAGVRLAIAMGCAASLISCSDAVRSGQASSYLVLTSLQSAGGTTVVQSDVRSDVNPATGQSTVVADPATAAIQVQMKDPGGLAPTSNNAITITQYHVKFTRTDGRNVEGVDVPFAFDGAVTTTVPAGSASTVGFTLVRTQAKLEAPLAALSQGNIPITTIATVTFFGHDQTGREVSVAGSIEVTFANFPG